MAMHLTTFSPRCCCVLVSTEGSLACRRGGLAYRDLEDELLAIVDGLKGVENGGELLGIELDCRPRQLHATGGCPDGRVEAREPLTIDDGTCCWVARLAKRKQFSRSGSGSGPVDPGARALKLTDDLVDPAITNTGSAGKPAEGRGPEAGRANGATSRRREGGTGPGEGGNAAARGGKSFASAINSSQLAHGRLQQAAVRRLGGNSPLEHRDDDEGRTCGGGCDSEGRWLGGGRKRVRKSLDELSARSCGAPAFHVMSCLGKRWASGCQPSRKRATSTTVFPQKLQGVSVPTNLAPEEKGGICWGFGCGFCVLSFARPGVPVWPLVGFISFSNVFLKLI